MIFGQITVDPLLPWWGILLLFSLGLALAALQYRSIHGKVGRSRAVILCLFRLSAMAFLILIALSPSLVSKREQRVFPSLAVLLDTSQSMGFSDQGEKGSRLDVARALLQGSEPLLKSLEEKFEVKLYTLGDSLRSIGAGEIGRLKGEGEKGDLNEALEKFDGKNSLVLLLSDGNVKWEDRPFKDLALIVAPVGNPQTYKDLLIREVKAPALAFRGRPVSVDVTIKGHGYKGLTLPVLLREGNKVLAAKNIQIDENAAEGSQSFSFLPEELGQHHLTVSIPSQDRESLTANNSLSFSLKVVRDKIRILMVSGSPSLSYRFMRGAFKNDPSIDLLSFVILRTPSDILNVPVQEQGLIPFPVETLFSKELKDFDLLIFDNFPYRLYTNPYHIESIREFVREGGSFAVVGGPNVSGINGYMDSPLGEMLPVRFTGKGDYRRDSSYSVRLGRPGNTHPVTQFSENQNKGQGLWSEMPSLDGINILEPKRSGTVLLESTDGTPRPILTVGSYGKGRVLVLATDYSWKWYMGMVAEGKAHWAYHRLMERMVRWLTQDPSLEPVQISFSDEVRAAGEQVEFRVRVREDSFPPGKVSGVSLSVFDPDGQKIESILKGTSEPGEYVGSFQPKKGGAVKLRVETPSGRVEESVVVPSPQERFDAAPDHERLKKISASTGGKLLLPGDDLLREIGNYVEKKEKRFVQERRISLWNTPFVLVPILMLLIAEWYFRRRWGLI